MEEGRHVFQEGNAFTLEALQHQVWTSARKQSVAVFANAFGSIVWLVLRAVIGTQQGRHQPCSKPRSATCSFLGTQSSNRKSTWFSANNITEFSWPTNKLCVSSCR